MPDETQPPSIPPNLFKIVEPADGAVHIYANISHLAWSGMDLTVQLYQLEQPNRDVPELKDAPNALVHEGNVTFSWSAAKSFHKLLGDVLERYEKVYGPINTEFKAI